MPESPVRNIGSTLRVSDAPQVGIFQALEAHDRRGSETRRHQLLRKVVPGRDLGLIAQVALETHVSTKPAHFVRKTVERWLDGIKSAGLTARRR
jgi:hypothetical protein